MKNLDISKTLVTSKGIIALTKSSYSRHIESLDLSDTKVDDAGLIAIGNSLNLLSIKNLELKGCISVTTLGLRYLANSKLLPVTFDFVKILKSHKIDNELIKSLS